MPDTPINTLIPAIILFGVFQGFLLLLFFSQKKRIHEHRFLVAFLGVVLFVQFYSFMVRSGLMFETLHLLNTDVPFILLFGPLVYLYSRDLSGKKTSAFGILIHFLPFLFYFAYSFNFFLQEEAYKFNVMASMAGAELVPRSFTQPFPSDPWDIQGWVVVEILGLHLIGYGILTLVKTGITKTGIKEKGRFQWLKVISGLLIMAGMVLLASQGGVVNGKVFYNSPFPHFSGDLFSTVAMYGTTLFLLFRSDFLRSPGRKYRKSPLPGEFMKDKLNQITSTIEETELFKDPEFSLDLVAEKTGLKKHHISQVINSELGCNFFALTNQYRVQEAKRILEASDYVKMEQLAYELGYKSKSSFFNAFKRETNQTPLQYSGAPE